MTEEERGFTSLSKCKLVRIHSKEEMELWDKAGYNRVFLTKEEAQKMFQHLFDEGFIDIKLGGA